MHAYRQNKAFFKDVCGWAEIMLKNEGRVPWAMLWPHRDERARLGPGSAATRRRGQRRPCPSGEMRVASCLRPLAPRTPS